MAKEGQILKDIEFFIAEEELSAFKVKEDRKKKKKKFNKGSNLNIKKLVVVDPYLVNYSLKDDVNELKSEKQKIQLNEMYKSEHNKLDLETELIDSKT